MKSFDKLFCSKIKAKIKTTNSWEKNQYTSNKEFGKEFLKNKLKEIQDEKNSIN